MYEEQHNVSKSDIKFNASKWIFHFLNALLLKSLVKVFGANCFIFRALKMNEGGWMHLTASLDIKEFETPRESIKFLFSVRGLGVNNEWYNNKSLQEKWLNSHIW